MKPMRIVGAHWTAKVNILHLMCQCNRRFEYPSTRWLVICPHCGATGHVTFLREEYHERRKHRAVR